jgi:LacI family purine nucleotide synthesis repressor
MARRFLQMKKRPTALSIVNDHVSLAFVVELGRAGVRVPEDVSVVSHDDRLIASYCSVPLTCVSQPVEAIAHAVCEMLLERLAASTAPPRAITFKGELVQRQSVARL